MKNLIVTFILISALSYLAASFISVSFNINKWGIGLRAVVAVSGFLGCFALYDTNNKNYDR